MDDVEDCREVDSTDDLTQRRYSIHSSRRNERFILDRNTILQVIISGALIFANIPTDPAEAEAPVQQRADKPKVLGEKTNNLVSPTKTPPRPPSKDFKHVLERQNLKRQASKQASFSEGALLSREFIYEIH